jgi:hypothetical protein
MPPDYATLVEAETALAELRQRLSEVDVTETVVWAHVARDVSGMLNAISLRTEPEPGRSRTPLTRSPRQRRSIASLAIADDGSDVQRPAAPLAH